MSENNSFDDLLEHDEEEILRALRMALRMAGFTQEKAAKALGVSLATLRRWLSGQGLTLARLGQLCRLAGVSLSELVGQIDQDASFEPLTLAQEQALTSDSALSTIFFILAAGWPASEGTTAFDIPEDVVEDSIERLHRLALVDRLPGGRVRARLDPRQIWARKPMLRHFDKHVKDHFFNIDYSEGEIIFGMEAVKLSPVGLALVHNLIQRFRADVREIASRDRRDASPDAEWYGVLAVARSFSGLSYRRANDAENGSPKPQETK